MKNNNINPIGLKGNQINERMKELMGIASIDENKTSSRVELTKIGPDGKAYAIVRENHEYFIKSTDKKTNIVAEDFKYIGGLQNIKSEAYKSYSSAIRHLNLKFNSLAESFNTSNGINVFKNDNLLTESGFASFSSESGNGFVGEGNMENNEPLHEWEDGPNPEEERDYDKEERDADDDADYKIKSRKERNDENVELSEAEQAITDMSEEEDESMPENPEDYTKQPGYVHEHKLSISRAIDNMDAIIDTLGESKKKVYTLK